VEKSEIVLGGMGKEKFVEEKSAGIALTVAAYTQCLGGSAEKRIKELTHRGKNKGKWIRK